MITFWPGHILAVVVGDDGGEGPRQNTITDESEISVEYSFQPSGRQIPDDGGDDD